MRRKRNAAYEIRPIMRYYIAQSKKKNEILPKKLSATKQSNIRRKKKNYVLKPQIMFQGKA